MTEGSLWRNILIFSLPLMLSQILQVLFNMADVAIVGKFSSSNAMGSVGSTSILVTLFTGFLIGMGAGVNVRVAQLLGAKRQEDTEKAVHTALLLCVLTGVIISGLCIFSAEWMLRLIRTRDDLLEGAELYFRIYALGMPAMGVFNFGNGVMSANGDTRRPLMYLLTAGILNVIMNLFFVIVCNMAEDGVALSSIISQYITAVLILVHMFRDKSACGLRLRSIRFWRGCSVPILVLGIPAGIQNAIFAVANLFIQRSVNYFDTVMVNGNSAASNADTLIYNMMSAFYTACSTFMGQNWGAGNKDRSMKSYYISLSYSFLIAAVLGVGFLLCGEPFLYIFTNDADVVARESYRANVLLSGLVAALFNVLMSFTLLLLALLFGFSHEAYVTFLPKSITTAIGMGVSEELGGIVSVTVVSIIVTGVLGNIMAEKVLAWLKIDEPVAKGIAIGSSSHAIGTAKAMEMGVVEGATSGLSIVVSGILTVVGASLFALFL